MIGADVTAPAADFHGHDLCGHGCDGFVCHGCGRWAPWCEGGTDCDPSECVYCNGSLPTGDPPCGLLCAECHGERHKDDEAPRGPEGK